MLPLRARHACHVALFDMPNLSIQYFIDFDILQNLFIDINIFQNCLIDIDIDIFKNYHMDIDICHEERVGTEKEN